MAAGAGLTGMGAYVTRFAPSPTGPLHLGHAYSALIAAKRAQDAGGRFLLRIEDIDQPRCRPEFEAGIFEDLAWLGLTWAQPVMRQSERLPAYAAALQELLAMGVAYHCTCTRGDIRAALSAPQEGAAPVIGPDGPVYPGTCRDASHGSGALRLNMGAALARAGAAEAGLSFRETGVTSGLVHISAADLQTRIGDVVLARRDIGTSYHLSVVVDDAAQGVTEVTRGADLFEATGIHILLQRLLGLPQPDYHHHALIRDDQGRRLAKRDDARALAKYRAESCSPEDIRRMLGLW